MPAVERFFQLSLLGLVFSGFLAVAGSGFLDKPTIFLVCAGLLLRGLLVAGVAVIEIPIFLINAATLAYIGFFALDYYTLSRDLLRATVHLVCFLAVIKILTARTNRDYLYTAAIALMELVAAAMLSVNMNFFVFLSIYLVCAIAAFTSAEMRRSLQKPSQIASSQRIHFAPRLVALTGFVTAGILLLTVGLFVILPRTANVAFRHLLSPRFHLSGFSREVTLGQIGEIQRDSHAVMHVRPYSRRMPANLKWRGTALTRFDGKRWSDPISANSVLLPRQSPVVLADDRQRSRTDGIRFSYGVDLNTSDSDALFVAGTPEFLNVNHVRVIRTPTDSYRLLASPAENVRYEVATFVPSRPPSERPMELSAGERSKYLQVPVLDIRIPELARSFAGEGQPWQRAQNIENQLRTKFSYTLDLPAQPPADPLANFLFERKRGHCEYFASAMTVMLRTIGIPARLVNGFQSGTWNSLSNLYVIRASDAHSWVEAFLPNVGWTTFDPTPSAPVAAQNSVSERVAMFFDAADTFWQTWVVNYDLNRQVTLAQRVEEGFLHLRWSWPSLVTSWKSKWTSPLTRENLFSAKPILLIVLLVIAFGYWGRQWIRVARNWLLMRKLRHQKGSPRDAALLYGRMLRLLHRRGYQKPAWFTPEEFAATLPPSSLSVLVDEFTEAYQSLRWGGKQEAAQRLTVLLQEIEGLSA